MENKTSKYFKYAIGEIVLVVIGILIALQINNWNENRKARSQEQELLNQLKSEFQSNLEQLDQKIQIRKNMSQASLNLLEYIDNPSKRNRDSIIKYLSITQLNPTFDPIVNDLASSGTLQLIQNQNLKEKLSLWTSEIVQVTEEEVAWGNISANFYLPYLYDHIPVRNITNQFWVNQTINSFHLDKTSEITFILGESKKKMDIDSFFDDIKFESYVAGCASFAELINSQSFSLRQRIIEILNIINSEIE